MLYDTELSNCTTLLCGLKRATSCFFQSLCSSSCVEHCLLLLNLQFAASELWLSVVDVEPLHTRRTRLTSTCLEICGQPLHPYRMMLGCSSQVWILLKSPGVTLAPRLLLGNNHAEIAGRQPPQFIPRLFPLCYLSSSHPELRCFRFYISNSNVSNWAESTRCRCLRRQILPLGPIWYNRMASLHLPYGPGKNRIWLNSVINSRYSCPMCP